MSISRQLYQYYRIRFDASHERDIERGEVSATTVVMAAALIALAIMNIIDRLMPSNENSLIRTQWVFWSVLGVTAGLKVLG